MVENKENIASSLDNENCNENSCIITVPNELTESMRKAEQIVRPQFITELPFKDDRTIISSVYKRLQEARALIQKKNLKKTGKNEYSKFEYFELDDILPSISEISNKVGICSVPNIPEEKGKDATIKIVNCDNSDDFVIFRLPYEKLEAMKQMNALQAMGGTSTYLRRYLYSIAFEISDGCSIDNEDFQKLETLNKKIDSLTLSNLIALGGKIKLNESKMAKTIKARYGKMLNELTYMEAVKIHLSLLEKLPEVEDPVLSEVIK